MIGTDSIKEYAQTRKRVKIIYLLKNSETTLVFEVLPFEEVCQIQLYLRGQENIHI